MFPRTGARGREAAYADRMPLLSVCGIVTRYADYRESDRIITLLTAEHGRLDAKARGCQRMGSALLPASQPFVYGRYELFYSRDKYTVNQCELLETFYPLREEYARFAAASAALQLAHNAAQQDQPNEALFGLLYHALSFWAYGKADASDLLICYLIRYLDVCGYRPSVTRCAHCGRDVRADALVRFDAKRGGAVCAACGGGTEISKTALEAMRRMLLLGDEEMGRVRLSAAIRRELLRCLPAYAAAATDHAVRALETLDIAALCADEM